MTEESRQCQNCKTQFVITPPDFEFYNKISVPAPTFCPRCRFQRRLALFNIVKLYKRTCDLCHKDIISMYAPHAPYTIYCPRCWFSDQWDPRDYGREYDFSRPFFEQYNELLHQAPLQALSLGIESLETSPYNNHAVNLKNCYLLFESMQNENCMYGFFVLYSADLVNCSLSYATNQSYDMMNAYKVSKSAGCRGQIEESMDCYFLRDSKNCQNCFGSANLKNKQYVFFNQQLTKDEYFEAIKKYDLGSYQGYLQAKKDAEKHWATQTIKAHYEETTQNCTGNYVFGSKNCDQCYEVIGAEDCKFMFMNLSSPQTNSYDISGSAGPLDLLYEGNITGQGCSDSQFIKDTGLETINAEYTNGSWMAKNHFGCVGARRTRNCILNKEYSEEEFKVLTEKIKKHMDEMPYVDAEGRVYKYGEFFPMEMSPLPYNDSLASVFFPMSKEEVLGKGLKWRDEADTAYEITMKAEDLPDHINEADEKIIEEKIGCVSCGRAFRIIKQEFDLLKNLKFPLPRMCPFCRVREKMVEWAMNLTTVTVKCSECQVKFETSVKNKGVSSLLCRGCYVKEFA